jgi:hypothetical protein
VKCRVPGLASGKWDQQSEAHAAIFWRGFRYMWDDLESKITRKDEDVAKPWNASGSKLIWLTGVVFALVLGAGLGAFWQYATSVEHPVSSKPIKVDYCFLFSYEDLFLGQPVETDADYEQVVEGEGIGKDECPENAATFSGPPNDDPIGKEWEKDLNTNRWGAEFNISFVGEIPSYPRYRRWYWEAKNHWQPTHHVPFIRILRLTHFERTR